MRRKAIGVCTLLIMLIFSACTNTKDSFQTQGGTTAPTNHENQLETSKPKIAEVQDFTSNCSTVVIPSNVERDTNLDNEKSLLTVHWYDNSKGKNVGVVFRYTDQNCSESAKDLIQHVLNSSNTENSKQEVRVSGQAKDGEITLTPIKQEKINQLGAPSCYGQADDYSIQSDYQVGFQSNGKFEQITTLKQLEMVQPKNEKIELHKWDMGDVEIFYFTPRYTDCHSQEFYLFGVREKQAFPITFHIGDRIFDHFDTFPHELPLLKDQKLIVKGGYGAGMDYVNLYDFTFDISKHAMILHEQKQVKPDYVLQP